MAYKKGEPNYLVRCLISVETFAVAMAIAVLRRSTDPPWSNAAAVLFGQVGGLNLSVNFLSFRLHAPFLSAVIIHSLCPCYTYCAHDITRTTNPHITVCASRSKSRLVLPTDSSGAGNVSPSTSYSLCLASPCPPMRKSLILMISHG